MEDLKCLNKNKSNKETKLNAIHIHIVIGVFRLTINKTQ